MVFSTPPPPPPPPPSPQMINPTNVTYPTPNVGGLDPHGPWVGGEPKSRSRVGTKLKKPASVYCYRLRSLEKIHGKRTDGSKRKLKVEHNDSLSLQSFSTHVWRHFVTHGLDSVF